MGQTVQGLFANENPSIVAMCRSVEKVVIDVAVEDFQPLSIKRKTQSVAVIIKSRFIQAYDHHDVSSRPLDPAMESQDSIVIGRSRSRVATGLVLTAPGVPMVFVGQEFLEDESWSDDRSPATLIWWDGPERNFRN